ncbi:hypothetical protein MA03_02365 [Infirmifilum uzonense]|jgi:hypothetical protein|uniref:Tyrosine specific protein phosphatases domain-containing protein n=2 Tax=Infirmifilum TaxID=2856573 RepID=A0A0F7CKW0_9CREN|nr:HD domain-containing protein [Infirmifilum uzonense]AKG38346.1 hypothetical protein MA03_02365 [Infirmifilum uzonense]
MARLRYIDGLYWSSCPDSELLASLAREGLSMIVDLTEHECSYEPPPGVEIMEYPIMDFSFNPFEDVLVHVALPVLQRLQGGEKVLVHCRGGIGRSGITVAMILGLKYRLPASEVKRKLSTLGFMGETPSQSLAFRWFFRARDLVGEDLIVRLVNKLESIRDEKSSYWELYKNHASTVAGVALDILEAISGIINLEREDYLNAYVAGLLHDVGRVVSSEEEHHEKGARLALELGELTKCCNRLVVSKAIFHHRRSTDLLGDPELQNLGEKARLIAATVRLADTFDDVYSGWGAYEAYGCYRGIELEGSSLIFLLSCNPPIWLERRLAEKSSAFETLTGIRAMIEFADVEQDEL